jgi:hypothetical protein
VSIVTWQVPVPVQVPLQPANLEVLFGVAVSVTVVPTVMSLTQSAPHAMPAGELVTVPVPAPDFVTRSSGVCAKVAVTLFAASIVTWQLLVPAQAPLQPTKYESLFGVAVSETAVPTA